MLGLITLAACSGKQDPLFSEWDHQVGKKPTSPWRARNPLKDVRDQPAEDQQRAFCASAAVSQLAVPIYADDPKRGDFQYHYLLVRARVQPKQATVVVIPGGPGEPSMNSNVYRMFPANWDVIYTDPRGIGCNKAEFNQQDSQAIRSDWIAADMVKMIQALELKDYFIYGHSYGTVVASLLVDQLSRLNPLSGDPVVELPRATLIEGIWGHAVESIAKHNEKFRQVSEGVLSKYSLSGLWQRLSRFWRMSLRQWNNRVYALTGYGDVWVQDAPQPYWMSKLERVVQQVAKAPADSQLTGKEKNALEADLGPVSLAAKVWTSEGVLADFSTTYRAILCQEMLAGRTDENDRRMCEGYQPVRLYDPAQLVSKVPVIYFQGFKDTQTPIAMARRHFEVFNTQPADSVEAAPARKKIWIEVEQAGHGPLIYHLVYCRDMIFQALLAKENLLVGSLEKAMASCRKEAGPKLTGHPLGIKMLAQGFEE